LTESQAAAQNDVDRLTGEIDAAIAAAEAKAAERDAAQARLDEAIADEGVRRLNALLTARRAVMKRARKVRKAQDVAASQLGQITSRLLGDEKDLVEAELNELASRLSLPLELDSDVSSDDAADGEPAGNPVGEGNSGKSGDSEDAADAVSQASADDVEADGSDATSTSAQEDAGASSGEVQAEESAHRAEVPEVDVSEAAEMGVDAAPDELAPGDEGGESHPSEEEVASLRARVAETRTRKAELDAKIDAAAESEDFDAAEALQAEADDVEAELSSLLEQAAGWEVTVDAAGSE